MRIDLRGEKIRDYSWLTFERWAALDESTRNEILDVLWVEDSARAARFVEKVIESWQRSPPGDRASAEETDKPCPRCQTDTPYGGVRVQSRTPQALLMKCGHCGYSWSVAR